MTMQLLLIGAVGLGAAVLALGLAIAGALLDVWIER